MQIIFRTYQQQMSLRAGLLQFGRARKRSLEEREGISVTGHHQKDIVTLK